MLVRVRSFASGFQALSVLLLLPGIASLRGISPGQLPAYLVEGVPATAGLRVICSIQQQGCREAVYLAPHI